MLQSFMDRDKGGVALGMAGMVGGPALSKIFGVGNRALTSGELLVGRLGAAEVAAQFSKSGGTLSDISPADFCRALAQHGVSDSLKLLYTRDAFGLPLEKAKETVIQLEYGSLDCWEKEMGDAIEGLPADSEPKKE